MHAFALEFCVDFDFLLFRLGEAICGLRSISYWLCRCYTCELELANSTTCNTIAHILVRKFV